MQKALQNEEFILHYQPKYGASTQKLVGVEALLRWQHPSYGLVMPDKITIFQKTIEAQCSTEAEIVSEIQKVVRHEIAHHFGISDARLSQLEKDED